jgi:hypothetical protein
MAVPWFRRLVAGLLSTRQLCGFWRTWFTTWLLLLGAHQWLIIWTLCAEHARRYTKAADGWSSSGNIWMCFRRDGERFPWSDYANLPERGQLVKQYKVMTDTVMGVYVYEEVFCRWEWTVVRLKMAIKYKKKDPGSVRVGFVVDKVAPGEVFPPTTSVFLCQFHSTMFHYLEKWKKTSFSSSSSQSLQNKLRASLAFATGPFPYKKTYVHNALLHIKVLPVSYFS